MARRACEVPRGSCLYTASGSSLKEAHLRRDVLICKHICGIWPQVGSLIGVQTAQRRFTRLGRRSSKALNLSAWSTPERKALLTSPFP